MILMLYFTAKFKLFARVYNETFAKFYMVTDYNWWQDFRAALT